MRKPMLYKVFVVCLWSGRTKVRIVSGLDQVEDIQELFRDFEWIGVTAEPAPLAYLRLSAPSRAA